MGQHEHDDERGPGEALGAAGVASADGSEAPEPSHSETRIKRPDAMQDKAGRDKTGRVSVRPSAFGPPRRSSAPPSRELSLPPEPTPAPAAPPAPAFDLLEEGESSSAWDMPEDESSPFKPAPSRASTPPKAFQAAPSTPLSSAPRAAPVPVSTSAAQHAPAPHQPSPALSFLAQQAEPAPAQAVTSIAPPSKRSRTGLVLFLGMLTLGGVSMWRYLRAPEERRAVKTENREREGLEELARVAASAESLSPADAQVADPTQELEQTVTTLLASGNRALEADDMITAERMFGRVIELDETNPRAAYGLAHVRLSQNNLAGAEGWIQLAIRKRPRRAAYHSLYAEILEKQGNPEAAAEERAHALEE